MRSLWPPVNGAVVTGRGSDSSCLRSQIAPSMSYPLVRRSPWLTIAEQPVRGLPDPGGRQSSGLGQPAWTGEGPIRAATVTGALAPDDAAGSIRIFMRQFAYGGVADWSSLRAWVIWVRV